MRYFVPTLKPGRRRSLIERAFWQDDSFAEKLGGAPFGLPAARWPKCAECGGSQSLLAQLLHHSTRLDLGREGRALFVFQCNQSPGMCSAWEKFSGANACFILEPEERGSLPSQIPADNPPLDKEAIVGSWVERDDGITASDAVAFWSEETFVNLPDDLARRATPETRLGSVPFWIQSPDEAPRPDWRFVGQLDGVNGANFSGDGIAYLFLKENGDDVPAGCFFWQR